VRYQRYVGGRHVVVPQPVRPDPGKSLSLLRGDDALPAPAHVERHEKVKVGIAVARKGERSETGFLDRNAQLLLELANERLFRPFARFHLAAGKLPEPRHRAPNRAFRKQNASVGVDEGAGGNQNKLHAIEPSIEIMAAGSLISTHRFRSVCAFAGLASRRG